MSEKIRLDTKYDLKGNYEPSSSEDEYSANDKRLLAKVRKNRDPDSESEEEVYAFSGSGSDSDSDSGDEKADVADSDVEGQEGSDDELPDPKAWGQKKKHFYNTDYVDADFGGFGKDEEIATLEEREAKALQTRLAQQLGDEDFSLEFFSSKKVDDKAEDETEIVVKSDLTQLSKRQKLQLLKKESPEFLGLIDDFKDKINIAKDTLRPILELVGQKSSPACAAIQFVKTYYETILNYCTNISFYIMLKTKKIPIQNHPVTKRLVQYRQILKQIEPIYEESVQKQLEDVLRAVKNCEKITILTDSESSKKRSLQQNKLNAKKMKLLNGNKTDKLNGLDRDDDSDGSAEVPEVMSKLDNEFAIDPESGKRAITYQMAKNKGLTPKRKKEQRNPRVKHRNKYRKAKIRRKGAIREVRTEVTRYDGEISGIKSNVKKSIKIR